jgi:putative colanic acid biosynthesis acetyltransferase WcaF
VTRVDFTGYGEGDYTHGASVLKKTLWWYTSVIFFESGLFPFIGFKNWLLRQFGAKVGHHVKIKPNVRIKFPWNLELGDHVWIGQGVWLDTVTTIKIGSHVLISQNAYLVSGSHDWSDPGMFGFYKPVVVEDGVWICAWAKIACGVTIGEEAVVLMGSVVGSDLEPSGIYSGHPATRVGTRKIRDYIGPKRAEPEAVPVAG